MYDFRKDNGFSVHTVVHTEADIAFWYSTSHLTAQYKWGLDTDAVKKIINSIWMNSMS